MTIPEASQLVLEGGSMDNGGEIFVFDIGARGNYFWSGQEDDSSAWADPQYWYRHFLYRIKTKPKIVWGLLKDGENVQPIYHEKIMIAKMRVVELDFVMGIFNDFHKMINSTDQNMQMVAKMKELIPEFLSQNSMYEKLDNESKVISIAQ